jgi:two-component system cell cycle response regulator DivK
MPASILIAEDYDDNRELLRLMLTSAGHEVREAKNGYECLTMAREQLPDLIMVDLSMPVLDGWGVFRELKADSRTEHVPCVAVTAHAESDRQRALQAGFNAYVSKPFRSEDLLAAVASLIANSKIEASVSQGGVLLRPLGNDVP